MWPFSSKETGTLKFFNKQKGFGYVKAKKGPDVYIETKTFDGRNLDKTPLPDGASVTFKAPAQPAKGKKSRAASSWSVA